MIAFGKLGPNLADLEAIEIFDRRRRRRRALAERPADPHAIYDYLESRQAERRASRPEAAPRTLEIRTRSAGSTRVLHF